MKITKNVSAICVMVLLFPFITSVNAFAQVDSTKLVNVAFDLHGTKISGTGDPNSIDAFFNPKEYPLEHSVAWNTHRNTEGDAPTLEFTSGEPIHIHLQLFFDTYEEKKSVAEYIAKIKDLTLVNHDTNKPNPCLFEWDYFKFKCVLESITVKYTLFLDDGTPVKATADVVFSKLVPADKKLNSYTISGKDLMKLLDASSKSFSLLDSYGTDSLNTVVDDMFGNLQTEKTKSILFSSINSQGNIQSLFSFGVDISDNTKHQDNSWETVHGGEMMIEQTETTVGSNKFHSFSPGHTSVSALVLTGYLEKDRAPIADWLKNPSGFDCKQCKDVVLSFYNNGKLLDQIKYHVIDAFYFKNEVLLLSIQDDKLHATILNIVRTQSDGTQFSGPPRIFVALPTSSPFPFPVLIAGTNFDQGAVPYFGNTPSNSLFAFGNQNIPLIGSLSTGFTFVPPAAPTGNGNLTVTEFGMQSNPFPFTKN